MTNAVSGLAAFLWRHWFRIGIALVAFFIVSRKQINFNIRLGMPNVVREMIAHDAPSAPATPAEPRAAENGLFSGISLFGSKEPAPAPAASLTPLLDDLLATDQSRAEAFIKRFAHVARSEQGKYGIPASIILANGLLHTRAGTNASALDLNNYFSLPCDTGYGEASREIDGRCLRVYETAWLSFRDHSKYLTSGRFRVLRDLPATDVERWAAGLERLRLNGTPNLAAQLLRTVEDYGLRGYDR